jgi:hypothetical protein
VLDALPDRPDLVSVILLSAEVPVGLTRVLEWPDLAALLGDCDADPWLNLVSLATMAAALFVRSGSIDLTGRLVAPRL